MLLVNSPYSVNQWQIKLMQSYIRLMRESSQQSSLASTNPQIQTQQMIILDHANEQRVLGGRSLLLRV
jgi:hypothetical protein